MLTNYKELKVWQKSYKLCLEIYRITAKFPKEERYGLTSQIRRSVVSIPSNTCPVKCCLWQPSFRGFNRVTEIERMLKALIKSLENKPLNPWPRPINLTILSINYYYYEA
jgi:hypothetical protein